MESEACPTEALDSEITLARFPGYARNRPLPIGDIVFLHGLTGTVRGTWQYPDVPKRLWPWRKWQRLATDTFWPDWLADDLPEARIWSIGYPARAVNFSGLGSGYALPDLAESVIDLLASRRDFTSIEPRAPLVFITHSMGGLLAKSIIRTLEGIHSPRWTSLRGRPRGVVFIATPHAGSDLADLARAIDRFTGVRSVAIRSLLEDSASLRELAKWYSNNAPRLGIQTQSYWETDPLVAGFKVVQAFSADAHVPGGLSVGVPGTNHASICKIGSRVGLVYSGVEKFCRDAFNAPLPGISGPIVLEPIPSASQISADDNYKGNANFWCYANFHMRTAEPGSLIAFEGDLVSEGIYATSRCPGDGPTGPGKIRINGDWTQLLGDYKTLMVPHRMAAGETIGVYYKRWFMPRLVATGPDDTGEWKVPADWLRSAQLDLRLSFWEDGVASPRELNFFFDYGESGWELRAISQLKEVRRLSAGELHAWRECGEISEADLRSLLEIEPGRRYLAARFPKYQIDNPVHLRGILEKLIERVDPRELYSDQGLTAALKAGELTGEQYDAFRKMEASNRLSMSYETESYPEAFQEGLRVAARRLFQERKDPPLDRPEG